MTPAVREQKLATERTEMTLNQLAKHHAQPTQMWTGHDPLYTTTCDDTCQDIPENNNIQTFNTKLDTNLVSMQASAYAYATTERN